MPLATPTGVESISVYSDPSYAAGEAISQYVGRLYRPAGREPVVYLHGVTDTPASVQAAAFQETINAVAGNSYPVLVPETGATAQWATNDTVGTGGFIDTAIAWAATPATQPNFGTSGTKVGLYGVMNGSLNALNWAWRNPGKVRSVVLFGPIVDPGAFYTANPSLQASIDADWGTHGAFLSALPTIDPMQNLALIRPFAHRILCCYAASDTVVDPAKVLAFAELVGAEVLEVAGGNAQVINGPAEAAAMWTVRKMRERSSAYIGWDEADWDRFTQVPMTLPSAPANNTNTVDTVVAPGGRRGEFVRVSGGEGNERHAYLLDELSAPDVSMRSAFYSQDGNLSGQQGLVLRGTNPTPTTYLLYLCWTDIVFNIPWWINRGKLSGTIGGNDIVLTDVQGGVIPGLRLNAGGQILASSRTSNVVTITVAEADADRNFRGGVLDIAMAGAIGGATVLGAVRTDANHIQYASVGANVASGGPGSWADFNSGFPYQAEARMIGQRMEGRFAPLGADLPDYGDVDLSFTWTNDVTAPQFAGYGRPGLFAGHVGILTPGVRRWVQWAAVAAQEQ